MTSEPEQSLYERIGGSEAIEAAIKAFYERVLADDRIAHYFDDIDMDRLTSQQQQFFEAGTGGPGTYDTDRIKTMHARHNIDQEAYDVFTSHFEDVLRDFEVSEQERAELMGAVHSFHDDVVGAE